MKIGIFLIVSSILLRSAPSSATTKHSLICFCLVVSSGFSPLRTASSAASTGWNGEHKHIIEYSLKLDSNPEFTSSVIVAYARAINRLHKEGVNGCKTVFDIAPAYLSKASGEELRAHLL